MVNKSSSKYFIGYNNDDVIRPLCIKLPQMTGYLKCLDSNKTISFKAIDNKLLKKYTKIWENVSSLMNIEFDSEPIYGDNDKYIKTKMKIYGNKVNTNFHSKKNTKRKTACKYLSLIMLDSVIRVNKKYHPQTLLEECKYEIKKTKMENLLEVSSPFRTTNFIFRIRLLEVHLLEVYLLDSSSSFRTKLI